MHRGRICWGSASQSASPGGHYPFDEALDGIIGLASPAALLLLLIFQPIRISATLERAR
jgi:hypothetical protein